MPLPDTAPPLHPDWQQDGNRLRRRLTLPDFAQALLAANAVGWLAEQANHHPDIALGWGYCTLTLTTHDASALTAADFALAARIDSLFP